jgi:hypothetical protein
MIDIRRPSTSSRIRGNAAALGTYSLLPQTLIPEVEQEWSAEKTLRLWHRAFSVPVGGMLSKYTHGV